MAWLFWICLNLFLAISIIMVLLVLIQKGRGGGLAGAFGGAGGNTAFGSKTGDVLTWATSVLFGVFLFLAVCVNWVSNAMEDNNRKQFQASIPTAGPVPAPQPAEPGVPLPPAPK